jgi:hypothetical protein
MMYDMDPGIIPEYYGSSLETGSSVVILQTSDRSAISAQLRRGFIRKSEGTQ